MPEPSGDHDGSGRPQRSRPGLRTKAAALLLLKIAVSLSFKAAVVFGAGAALFLILAIEGRIPWRMVPFQALVGGILALPLRYLEKVVERHRRQVEDELRAGGED